MQENEEIPKITIVAIIILVIGIVGLLGTLQSLLLVVGIVLHPETNPTALNVNHLIVTNIFSGVFSAAMIICGVGLLNRRVWAAKVILFTIIIQAVVAVINIVYSYMANKPIKVLIISFGIEFTINGIIGYYLWLKIFKGGKKSASNEIQKTEVGE